MFTQKLIDNIIAYKLHGTIPDGTKMQQYRFINHYSPDDWKVSQLHCPVGQNEIEGKHVLFWQNKMVVTPEQGEKILQEMYNEPTTQLNGRDRLFARVYENYEGITKNQVMKFLQKQETYQLHHPVYKQKVVKPIIVTGPNVHWQADLIDMSGKQYRDELTGKTKKELPYWNSNHVYILTIVDLFSKFAWAVPLKNKEAKTVSLAIENIFKQVKPKVFQSDNGSEFKSNEMAELSKKMGVRQHFSRSYTPQSQGAVEKFNGTLKGMISRYMTHAGTKNWVNVLP